LGKAKLAIGGTSIEVDLDELMEVLEMIETLNEFKSAKELLDKRPTFETTPNKDRVKILQR
jgi:uncharacterized protein YqgV (UPF0045/DUF77 family)